VRNEGYATPGSGTLAIKEDRENGFWAGIVIRYVQITVFRLQGITGVDHFLAVSDTVTISIIVRVDFSVKV
jgi:hypothetical protein